MTELTACYDLSVSPPTYDAVSFMLAAEMERIARGCDTIAVRILPGPADGFRSDRLPPFDVGARQAMRDNILVPLARLLPSCRSCFVEDGRPRPAGETFGYGEACYGFRYQLRAAQENVYPLRSFRAPSIAGPYVTITLREAPYWPTRNSNLTQWVDIAQRLRSLGLRVMIVRDTRMAAQPLRGLKIAAEASTGLLARAALYAGAELNLFVNNGPAWLCLHMGAPCLIVKLTAPDAPCVNDAFFAGLGFPRGATWPNLKARQRVSWGDEEPSSLVEEAMQLLDQPKV